VDNQSFIAFADWLRRNARDPALIEFLDYAVALARGGPRIPVSVSVHRMSATA